MGTPKNQPIFEHRKGSTLTVIPRATLGELVTEIKRQVGIYLNSKQDSTKTTIFDILNRVAEIFQSSGEDTIRNALSEIHKKDRELWKNHQWEIIKPHSRVWQEEHNNQAHKRIGIVPEDIMGLPKSCPAGRVPLGGGLVERRAENSRERALVAIYGTDSEFLRALSRSST